MARTHESAQQLFTIGVHKQSGGKKSNWTFLLKAGLIFSRRSYASEYTWGSLKETKPKPRDLFVLLSRTTRAFWKDGYFPKARVKCSSDTSLPVCTKFKMSIVYWKWKRNSVSSEWSIKRWCATSVDTKHVTLAHVAKKVSHQCRRQKSESPRDPTRRALDPPMSLPPPAVTTFDLSWVFSLF